VVPAGRSALAAPADFAGVEAEVSPVAPLKVLTKPVAKRPMKPKKSEPVKLTMHRFNRFSRFKVTKEAEHLIPGMNKVFIDLAMARPKQIAEDRGANKIALCDIRDYMTECGFLPSAENDPRDLHLMGAIRELDSVENQLELIPMCRSVTNMIFRNVKPHKYDL
jgi:hypothetical protein